MSFDDKIHFRPPQDTFGAWSGNKRVEQSSCWTGWILLFCEKMLWLFNIAEWLRRGPWSAISTGLPRQGRRWPARRWSCPSLTSISCRARTTTWARWGWPTWERRRRERCCTSTTQPGQTSGCPPALTPSSSSLVLAAHPLPFVLAQVLCRRGEGLGQLVIVSGAGGRSLLRRNWQVSLQQLSTRLSSLNKFVFNKFHKIKLSLGLVLLSSWIPVFWRLSCRGLRLSTWKSAFLIWEHTGDVATLFF